jgi:hypothetical protein
MCERWSGERLDAEQSASRTTTKRNERKEYDYAQQNQNTQGLHKEFYFDDEHWTFRYKEGKL